jgi:hypothetical protein
VKKRSLIFSRDLCAEVSVRMIVKVELTHQGIKNFLNRAILRLNVQIIEITDNLGSCKGRSWNNCQRKRYREVSPPAEAYAYCTSGNRFHRRPVHR